MWIKICGITTVEDAQFAARAGADAVGLVFAESARRVTRNGAAAMARELPREVEKIGVFVDADLDTIEETVRVAHLTGVQLHNSEGPVSCENSYEDGWGMIESIRERLKDFQGDLRVVQAMHFDGDSGNFVRDLTAMRVRRVADAILVDSRAASGSAARQGGTGIQFDWKRASEGFLGEASHLKLIAAGGLSPENVDRAIQTLRPWGVDVASGVESALGRKDPKRVAAFIDAARRAAAEMEQVGGVEM